MAEACKECTFFIFANCELLMLPFKGHWTNYSIYVFAFYSTMSTESNKPIPNFSADSANVFVFYRSRL